MYGKGISREGSLIDMSVDLGIVKKSGAWFTYEGEQLGQGRENAKTFLAENPEVMVEISDQVLAAAGLKPGGGEAGRRRRRRRAGERASTTEPVQRRRRGPDRDRLSRTLTAATARRRGAVRVRGQRPGLNTIR